jgi:hypothetical protein
MRSHIYRKQSASFPKLDVEGSNPFTRLWVYS